MLNIVRSLAGN